MLELLLYFTFVHYSQTCEEAKGGENARNIYIHDHFIFILTIDYRTGTLTNKL